MRAVAPLALALLLLAPGPGAADALLALDGPLIQGGLVVGHTRPGARVAVDGRTVRVAADGLFLVGLGRDAERVTVTVAAPDGATATRVLEVARRTWDVQRIDGLPERQVTPGPEELARIQADGAAIAAARVRDSALTDFRAGFIAPAEGRISGVFGSQRILNGQPRNPHNGLDIAAPEGTPVVAAAAGVVALARDDMFFTGLTVIVDHGHGLSSIYAHMSEIAVEEGQHVEAGAPIGRIGASGRVTGAHLHWGVSLFSTHLDPGLLVGMGR